MVEDHALAGAGRRGGAADYSDFTRNGLILVPELRHMTQAMRMPASGSIG
jgi:hypothetical protein